MQKESERTKSRIVKRNNEIKPEWVKKITSIVESEKRSKAKWENREDYSRRNLENEIWTKPRSRKIKVTAIEMLK